MRIRHVFVIALAVVTPGCANDGPASDPMSAHPPESNQRILTRSESLALVAWAERFRTCMSARGITMPKLIARSRQLNLRIEEFEPQQALANGTRCGDTLGGPPEGSSLQLASDGFILYLPVQCLLDENVRQQHS